MSKLRFVIGTIAVCAIGAMVSETRGAPLGTDFSYQAQLKLDGVPLNDTADFEFSLYDAASNGLLVAGPITVSNVAVVDGLFQASLDFGVTVLDGSALWLEVAVRSPHDPGDTVLFTTLEPRHPLTGAPYALQTRGIFVEEPSGEVGIGTTTPAAKLHATGIGNAILGVSTTSSAGSIGVKGEGPRFGVVGVATGGAGLSSFGVCGEAKNEDGYAGYFRNVVAGVNPGGIAVFAESSSRSKDSSTLRVNNTSGDGATAYFTASSSLSTVYIYQRNRFLGQSGGVLRLRNGGEDADGTGGGHFIEAVNDDESDVQFRVLTDGEAQSDVGFTTPAADFAEMLPAGAEDLVPGDVLALDSTGKLIRSTKPFQPTVVGVYSTRPGFVGGKPLDGAIKGTIPLAMIGVVPVKVSAENGPIQPGDMLVASSIAGHAMRAGDKPPIGTVIGKALQPLTKQRGVIRLLLSLQ